MKRSFFALVILLSLSAPVFADDIVSVITTQEDVTVTGTATLVAAANEFRSALSITNNDAAIAVRWGDSAVTATRGQRLPAGASIEIKNRGAVYMIAESDTVAVSVTEEAR